MRQYTSRDDLHPIPNAPGVYFFFSHEDHLLYIGKSVTLRDRVRSHFYSARQNSKEERLTKQTSKIAWQETTGELGALLLEADLIKKCQPIYNRMLRRTRILHALKLNALNEYHQVETQALRQIDYPEVDTLYGLSRSKARLQEQWIELVKSFQLCGKLSGLEKKSGPCFYFQLKRCQGACIQLETPREYNERLMIALECLKTKSWPYDKPLIIEEKDFSGSEVMYHLVDKWCHVGSATSRIELEKASTATALKFDFDIYKILARYLLKQ